jgi:hypothetical protein
VTARVVIPNADELGEAPQVILPGCDLRRVPFVFVARLKAKAPTAASAIVLDGLYSECQPQLQRSGGNYEDEGSSLPANGCPLHMRVNPEIHYKSSQSLYVHW